MKRTILTFIAKPHYLSFGGNDAFAIQLTKNWASKEDRLIFAFNALNPCREVFRAKLQAHATLELLDESMLGERRAAILKKTPHSLWRRKFLEWSDDLLRPLRAVACIYRFTRLIGRYHPDAALLNVGGNPPEDLGWRMMIAAWIMRVPKIILINQSYPGQGTTPARRLVLFILRRMTRFFCDVLVAPSQDMVDVFTASMADKRPGVVIPYGIDAQPENSIPLEVKRQNLKLHSGLSIGVVGNAEERKGLHVLVQAMPAILKEFPETQLVLIGFPMDPVYVEKIKNLIIELKLEAQVNNVGFLPEAGQYFECFDVCVVPSTYAEGFGIVAIEALRYKKPVVAAATGGLKEVIVDGETGFVVPPNDVAALSDAILKLLRSPTLRQQMGENSLKRFNDHYRTEAMAKRYYLLTS